MTVGEIVRELDDGVVIRRVSEDADDWRAPFTGAYQTIFSGPPYFERYYPSEAEGVFRKLTRTPGNITLLATRGLTSVVGFGVAIPLAHKPSVAVELTGLVPIAHTMYLAELGVLESHRGAGLGKVLVQERLAAIDPNNYTHVVLRVSAGENPSSHLYKELGFEEMGVYMEVSSMRTDGRVKTDRRLFLSKVLSQVDL
ncbi:MAG: GNAT family N-acetyltransferase [Myxococcales bacterium]|nr:GNAT family N-acetyltransferase [Myxococcales bacterium]MCB9692240.1 GNAT family N-acetyltransferase [Alphaproteobacteria bacterium]